MDDSPADFYIENGIVFGKYKEGIIIDLEVAKEVVETRKVISEYKNRPIFVDARGVNKMTKEARNYFGSKEGAEYISAAAIFTDSMLTSFMANFLIRVNLKEQYTIVRAFNNREKAIEWLSQYK
ncbi:MAG: hypothetical protein HUJ25_12830 [Crocinitomicaceae bacterium]|nr:hypothetical protein [Crocinitomicaceae bacterium]